MIDGNDNKYLQVDRLIELLGQLNSGDRLYPNSVHNLLVTDQFGNYKAFIDFLLQGEIEFPEP